MGEIIFKWIADGIATFMVGFIAWSLVSLNSAFDWEDLWFAGIALFIIYRIWN